MDRRQSTILQISRHQCCLDHGILLNRLQISFGITGHAHDWIRSYLSNREQFVRIGESCSTESICYIAVPQGSVLGPIIFSLYISPISSIAIQHGITQQQYADDTQLYIAVSNSDHAREIQRLEACLLAMHVGSAQTVWR